MSHISTVGKVRSRVCKESLLRKNYKAHLQGQHPCEDSSNLNPAEQPTVADTFIFSPNLYIKSLLKIRPLFWLFMLYISGNFVLKFTQKRFKHRPILHQRASKYPGLPGP